MMPLLVIGAFIGGFVALISWISRHAFKAAQARADALTNFGAPYGMRLKDPIHKNATPFKITREPVGMNLKAEYPGVPIFKMYNCRFSNVLEGKDDRGQTLRSFDAQYTVSTGKSSHTYFYTVATVDTGQYIPELALHHESLWDKMKKWFGNEDIKTGNEEFDSKFRVESSDEAFARSLLMSEMQDRILGTQPCVGQYITGGKVVVLKYGLVKPDELAKMFDHASFIAERATRPEELSRVRYALEHSSKPVTEETPTDLYDQS